MADQPEPSTNGGDYTDDEETNWVEADTTDEEGEATPPASPCVIPAGPSLEATKKKAAAAATNDRKRKEAAARKRKDAANERKRKATLKKKDPPVKAETLPSASKASKPVGSKEANPVEAASCVLVESKSGARAPPKPYLVQKRAPTIPVASSDVAAAVTKAEAMLKSGLCTEGLALMKTVLEGLFVYFNIKNPKAPTVSWFLQESVQDNTINVVPFSSVPELRTLVSLVEGLVRGVAPEDARFGTPFTASREAANWVYGEYPASGDDQALTDTERFLIAHTGALYPAPLKTVISKLGGGNTKNNKRKPASLPEIEEPPTKKGAFLEDMVTFGKKHRVRVTVSFETQ